MNFRESSFCRSVREYKESFGNCHNTVRPYLRESIFHPSISLTIVSTFSLNEYCVTLPPFLPLILLERCLPYLENLKSYGFKHKTIIKT